MSRLQGKVAVITGGAGGIGVATARKFVDEGARVVLADLDADALARAADPFGDAAVTMVTDVTLEADNEALVARAVEAFGGLDVFVANAGIEGRVAPIGEQAPDIFDAVMAVNVRGVWLGLRAAIPALEARGGGALLITASTAGIKGSANISPYVTSKHAVIGLMRSVALEVAPSRIRVNTVNPSPTETRMMRSLEDGLLPGDGQAAHARIAESIPLGEYGQPSDVANLFCFLASDEARFLTGGVYMVDGGTSAS